MRKTSPAVRPYHTVYLLPRSLMTEERKGFHGHAKTLRGAIRAAVPRLFNHEAINAHIYDSESGELLVSMILRTARNKTGEIWIGTTFRGRWARDDQTEPAPRNPKWKKSTTTQLPALH